MFRSKKSAFSVSIAKEALESIFDECDRYDIDETGGRLVGSYRQKGTEYDIEVLGVIPPGPNAQRSPTSFFQDGEYQEKVFRSIEERHPNVEHLGNWHTHHVNGYPTLSGGDKTTYFKIVNHEKHNTDFLLCAARSTKEPPRKSEIRCQTLFLPPQRRYDLRDSIQTGTAFGFPRSLARQCRESKIALPIHSTVQPAKRTDLERAKDQDFFSELYPDLKALFSKNAGALYWKGPLRWSMVPTPMWWQWRKQTPERHSI